MPRGDGTGPGGSGGGRRGGRGAGPAGNCVCPKCGHVQAHDRGTPCTQVTCAKCGAAMIRQ